MRTAEIRRRFLDLFGARAARARSRITSAAPPSATRAARLCTKTGTRSSGTWSSCSTDAVRTRHVRLWECASATRLAEQSNSLREELEDRLSEMLNRLKAAERENQRLLLPVNSAQVSVLAVATDATRVPATEVRDASPPSGPVTSRSPVTAVNEAGRAAALAALPSLLTGS
ncbi:hypothetical protein KUM39_20335 [Streptomyces sp. J2-1]|uniref:hypothetical protein n=1 Tax=Streptomyces corallincola TaxID=2851888 RepID=UPI001C38B406|nr:hypothetical protein [Streptomyces corallincola]MBV2356694.1 hypothetical protein [Streptomyces corallincola]